MLDFIIVGVCLVLNAFFSAYEMAFVTVTREEIDELEDKSSSILSSLKVFKKNPERTLSVIQIGITLVGMIAAAVGGTGAVENLEPYFVQKFDISKAAAEAISVVIVIVPLTYFSVVFGELLPKTIALKHPIAVLSFGTKVLSLIDSFLSPIVSFLEISTSFLLKIIGLGEKNEEDESMGESVEIGNLADYHKDFVRNLVSLKGMRTSRAMTPWSKVTFLNFSESEEEVRHKLSQDAHSRFPVIDGDVVVGLLLKKDLLEIKDPAAYPWQGILRPIIKVSANQKILDAFLKMQEKQIPLAVVEDSDGAFIGILTIEDIIEEIVGDINDRTDFTLTAKMLSNRPSVRMKTFKK